MRVESFTQSLLNASPLYKSHPNTRLPEYGLCLIRDNISSDLLNPSLDGSENHRELDDGQSMALYDRISSITRDYLLLR